MTDSVDGRIRNYSTLTPVIMIETELALMPGEGFDSSALDDLVLEVVNRPEFERLASPIVRIVSPTRGGAGGR